MLVLDLKFIPFVDENDDYVMTHCPINPLYTTSQLLKRRQSLEIR